MQAAYDSENLYIRLNFKSPADAGAKADKEEKSPMHEVKAAIIMAGPKIDMGSQVGCRATCHGDVRSMPGADRKKKKHVKDANVANGNYDDCIQWKAWLSWRWGNFRLTRRFIAFIMFHRDTRWG